MSRRVVWTTTLALLAAVGLVGSAAAQYAGNGYPNGDYDYGPNNDYYGGAPYAPDGYPEPDPRYRQPQSYNYEQDEQLGPQYTEPPQSGGENERSGGPSGDESLGESINQRTRTEVPNPTSEPPGTIIVNTGERYLYLTERNGQALRYGIGVGREGFAWKGTAQIKRKAAWPGWTPPADMLKRRPDLPRHMSGGIDNPLGARALYLFNGKGDTGFRIHGTNEPDTIGKAVSSGCIRMMNGDVIDLFTRVPVGTKVVVL